MQWSDLTWAQVDGLPRSMPVVIPIASVEQHGHHLPLYTDSMLLGEVLRRAHEPLAADILMAPLQWYGNSHHHLDFSGTLSSPPRVYLDLLVALLENFVFHGFTRLILLNGHGGNEVPGKQATFEVRQTHRDRPDLLLLYATYWSVGAAAGSAIGGLQQAEMGHACEWETSMMLCIAPNLVGDYRAAEEVVPGNPFLPAARAWVTQDRSKIGHIGYPEFASPEKGEALLVHFSNNVRQLLERMIAWDGYSWEG